MTTRTDEKTLQNDHRRNDVVVRALKLMRSTIYFLNQTNRAIFNGHLQRVLRFPMIVSCEKINVVTLNRVLFKKNSYLNGRHHSKS